MNVNVVFCSEEELSDLDTCCSKVKEDKSPIIIFIRLKLLSIPFEPLIKDLQDIRIKKIEKRIGEVFTENKKERANTVIRFIRSIEEINQFDFKLKPYQTVKVFSSPLLKENVEKRIKALLKGKAIVFT